MHLSWSCTSFQGVTISENEWETNAVTSTAVFGSSLVASSTLASPPCSIVIDKVLTNSWLCHLVWKTADIQEGYAPASEPTKFRFLIKHLQHQ